MPLGMWVRQKFIGVPKIRKSTPYALRCAAIDNPYGPAPMITTSQYVIVIPLFHAELFSHLGDADWHMAPCSKFFSTDSVPGEMVLSSQLIRTTTRTAVATAGVQVSFGA